MKNIKCVKMVHSVQNAVREGLLDVISPPSVCPTSTTLTHTVFLLRQKAEMRIVGLLKGPCEEISATVVAVCLLDGLVLQLGLC